MSGGTESTTHSRVPCAHPFDKLRMTLSRSKGHAQGHENSVFDGAIDAVGEEVSG